MVNFFNKMAPHRQLKSEFSMKYILKDPKLLPLPSEERHLKLKRVGKMINERVKELEKN